MKKLNNKGFVLAEVLVVSVFVMSIFTLLYVNFYPLIGEYEKREGYDDIDSTYQVYWIKRMLQDSSVDKTEIVNKANNNTIYTNKDDFCKIFNNPFNNSKEKSCKEFLEKAEVNKICITPYNITNFKKNNSLDNRFKSYINFLPNYNNIKKDHYRIIVEFKRTIDKKITNEEDDNKYYTYANIEVNAK